MNVIKELGFLICIAMVLMVYLKQLLPAGKNATIVKGIISVFVLLSILSILTKGHWKNWNLNNQKVLDDASIEEMVAEGLMNECNRFLEEQKTDAEVIDLKVEDGDGYEIVHLCIVGQEGDRGKALLSARYQIQYDRIEVKNEN